MAGIYIHIPFCKSRCAYCDFYSTTELPLRTRYVDALIREYELRRNELTEAVRTIYIGGGTPSQLKSDDLARLLQALPTEEVEELTVEANPQDITPDKLVAWREAGVNRLSIGIQSFHNRTLRRLGRRHDAQAARKAVEMAKQYGFTNISIDLIYATPEQTMEEWQEDIEEALALDVPHISTYCLMYEKGTPLYELLEKGRVEEIDEDTVNDMYAMICQTLNKAGYEHYEVSNFARPGYKSKHNSNYWNDTPYLGLGAGAHSYDGKVRRANHPDLLAYLSGLMHDEVPHTDEVLTANDHYNEQIMLGLRTSQGVAITERRLKEAQKYIDRGLLTIANGHIRATQQGLNILNRII